MSGNFRALVILLLLPGCDQVGTRSILPSSNWAFYEHRPDIMCETEGAVVRAGETIEVKWKLTVSTLAIKYSTVTLYDDSPGEFEAITPLSVKYTAPEDARAGTDVKLAIIIYLKPDNFIAATCWVRVG